MFLTTYRNLGRNEFVFTHIDPRMDGCEREVIEDVRLEYDMNAIHRWPDGAPRPSPQLGRDPQDQKHYKVFKFPHELQAAGFQIVHSNAPLLFYSWQEFSELFPTPVKAEERMESDEWFDHLDDLDAAVKHRRERDPNPDPKPGSTRDEIAEWLSKTHLSVDGSIREVWYLPTGAPEDEIRLIEVNDRYVGEGAEIVPFDMGIEVNGAPFKLRVVDITPNQLEKIKTDSSMLPKGWNITDQKICGAWWK